MKDYPTEEQLKEIESFDLIDGDVNDLLCLVEDLWNWPDWGFKRDEDYLELHTGGWSGNESIIYALRENKVFWYSYWRITGDGGHYYFYLGNRLDDNWKIIKK